MDARLFRTTLLACALLSLGANYRTQNFVVTADGNFAQQVATAAETYRRKLAIEWLGKELPPWHEPCPIQVNAGQMGAGGATSFAFHRGRPVSWRMSVQGSPQRIIDSVLPHEVTHTIFATHFGRPLPRWADEGACTTVEHASERQRQRELLRVFLTSNRGIPFNSMFAMMDYPRDMLPLYSQGYSVARYLIAQGGRRKFVDFVGDGMNSSNWTAAVQSHYGFKDLSDLQVTWLDWVRRGNPPVKSRATLIAAAATQPATTHSATVTGSSDPTSSQPSALPSTRLVSVGKNGPAGDGWYARHARRSQRSAAESGRQSKPPMVEQSVTRPQPVGRPQQIILDAGGPRGRFR